VTWGVLRPRVILPAGSVEWPEVRARVVLRHELAHVRRGDWIMQMIAQTLRIVYWFNPVVWIACRRLRLESECACDDSVLSDDIKGHEYAEHLLDLARALNKPGQSWSAALTMSRPSTIERRFAAMLNPGLNRYPLTRFGMLSMVLIGLSVTFALSAASTATESPLALPAAMAPPQARAQTPTNTLPQTGTRWTVAPAQSQRGRERFEDRRNSALDRALFEIAGDGKVAEIEELLRAGANANALLLGDGTPLMEAAGEGHLDVVRLLLDRGADPNVVAPGDGSALISAAHEGHLDVVQLLLTRGADPNIAVPGDGAPLIAAASEGHLGVSRLLLDYRADPDIAVPGDGSPLIAASSEGHLDIVQLLLDRGAKIDQVVPGDENALIQASGEGHLDVVRLLVNRRADVNIRVWVEGYRERPGEWRTALSQARRKGYEDIARFLISVGARE